MPQRRLHTAMLVLLLMGGVAWGQSGSGDAMMDDATMTAHTVDLTVTNQTEHQVFSAPVAVAHDASYQPFELHHPLLSELVPLAEDGRTTDFQTVARVMSGVGSYDIADSNLAPGESVTLSVEVDAAHPLVSVFGMLVTSNDAAFVFGTDVTAVVGMDGGSMSSEDMSGDAMAGEDMSGDDMAGDAMAGEDMSGDDMAGDAMAGDAMAGEDMSGDDMSGDAVAGGDMSGDSMSGDSMSGDSMSADDMAPVDLYDGTVRVLDAGSEANTESCHDVPGPPCGSVGVRHVDMAEGTVELHHGLTGDGDLDAMTYGWVDPVASVAVEVH
jgi:pentapeptide MXKDX repeat protein